MLVEFKTTTDIHVVACILHDLTTKIIETPPVQRFVLQVHKVHVILTKNRSELKIVININIAFTNSKRTTSEFTCFVGTKVANFVLKFTIWLAKISHNVINNFASDIATV